MATLAVLRQFTDGQFLFEYKVMSTCLRTLYVFQIFSRLCNFLDYNTVEFSCGVVDFSWSYCGIGTELFIVDGGRVVTERRVKVELVISGYRGIIWTVGDSELVSIFIIYYIIPCYFITYLLISYLYLFVYYYTYNYYIL